MLGEGNPFLSHVPNQLLIAGCQPDHRRRRRRGQRLVRVAEDRGRHGAGTAGTGNLEGLRDQFRQSRKSCNHPFPPNFKHLVGFQTAV
jgi:hypothetical protein